LILERLVWIRRMLRNGSWIVVDLLLQQIDGGIELSVRSVKSGVGRVVDHDVGFDAVALDEPLPSGP
jgi:hypothetical protein